MFVFCRLLVAVCFFNSLSRQSHKDLLFRFSTFLSLLPFPPPIDQGLQVGGAVVFWGALVPAWHFCTPCTRVLFSCHLRGQLGYFTYCCTEQITWLSKWIRQNATLKIQHQADHSAKKRKKKTTKNPVGVPDRVSWWVLFVFVLSWLVIAWTGKAEITHRQKWLLKK